MLPQNDGAFTGERPIFIIAGQSNADGRALTARLTNYNLQDSTQVNATIYDRADTALENLKVGPTAPVNNNPRNLAGSTDATQFGFELTLANRLRYEYGKIGLIKYAVGGTASTTWNPTGGTNFANLSTYYTEAKTLFDALPGETNLVEAMFWYQGESDASSGVSTATYQSFLSNFYDGLKTLTGNPNFKLYICKLKYSLLETNYTNANADLIRTAQVNFANATNNVYLVDIDDITFYNDLIHLSHIGQYLLGFRLANLFINT